MANERNSTRGARPTHRLVMFHNPDDSKSRTEVGAAWPHDNGGGFSLVLKKGLALVMFDGARLALFPIENDDAGDGRTDDRNRSREDQARGRR